MTEIQQTNQNPKAQCGCVVGHNNDMYFSFFWNHHYENCVYNNKKAVKLRCNNTGVEWFQLINK